MTQNYSIAHVCSSVRDAVEISLVRKNELVWDDLRLSLTLAFRPILVMTSNYSTAHKRGNVSDEFMLLRLT